MRKCPFCKANVKLAFPALMYLEELDEWSLLHNCSGNCGVLIRGKTKEEVIAVWNGDDHAEEQKSESL